METLFSPTQPKLPSKQPRGHSIRTGDGWACITRLSGRVPDLVELVDSGVVSVGKVYLTDELSDFEN